MCDGYESVLTPAGLGDLTPGALDKLAAGENNANVGKLIYGNTWYLSLIHISTPGTAGPARR